MGGNKTRERPMTKSKDLSRKIKEYWEDPNTISLIDINLRRLEESVALPYLKADHDIADLGCGDGASTIKYAAKVRSCLAFEQSEHLSSQAAKRFKDAGITNVKIVKGSMLEFPKYDNAFDVIITQRALINLTSWDDQMEAIRKICVSLKKGGRYIMIENTYEGQEALNTVRRAMGLSDIPLHWHNLFFYNDALIDFVSRLFSIERHCTFDLYYLITRVYLNMFANFEGFGVNAKKDDVFKNADSSAATLFETIGDSIKIGDKYAFGPIQGFVLKKK